MLKGSAIVTGGLGFIGSAICEALLGAGIPVTIVDSLISNVVEPDHFTTRYPHARVETLSVADFFVDPTAVPQHSLVIHTASLVGPAGILAYAGTIGSSIVEATSRVIEHCLLSRASLLYFSSAEVYGRSGVLSESMEIRVPPAYSARIEYSLGKLTSEAMIVNSRHRGLRATIIRPFNVVGARQSRSGGFVMPTFVQQALGGMPITIFGTGEQQRAFTCVTDIVAFVMNHAAGTLDLGPHIYNVGNPANATTIGDLAYRVRSLLNSSSEIIYTSGDSVYGPLYSEAESFEKLPDIANALRTGWSPRKTLDNIITDTATFYRQGFDPRGADARRAVA